MERVSADPTMPRRTEEANVFRVASADLRGWVVYRVGHPKTDQFLSQALAVEHAQRCAQDNRPSVVVVIEGDGTVVAGWEFPLETERIA
jgi:hypothetical protein